MKTSVPTLWKALPKVVHGLTHADAAQAERAHRQLLRLVRKLRRHDLEPYRGHRTSR